MCFGEVGYEVLVWSQYECWFNRRTEMANVAFALKENLFSITYSIALAFIGYKHKEGR